MVDHEQHIDEAFEANSKSVLAAYLLWFFFGMFNVHRFYAGKTKSAVIRLIMACTVILLPIVVLLWVIDLFLIPSMIGEQNLKTINLIKVGASGAAPSQTTRDKPRPALTEADKRREAMLEDLRATGYRKERRDTFGIYR